MSQIITEETLNTVVAGTKGMAEILKAGATTLTDETIKLYIFYGIMGVLKALAVFVVFGIVVKFLSTVDKANESPSKMIKGMKTTALILSIVYFTANSMPHLLDIGKAMVAPNLFLMEKSAALLEKSK